MVVTAAEKNYLGGISGESYERNGSIARHKARKPNHGKRLAAR